ncbi:CDP-glycerol glycerophosphotransferase family protein [Sporosarcina thermotolerans]|uniref:CDP-glycerol glycerophosphotransferase family protein n=1 Tax=Sporosarcina thermotolerans TaxID=633404 RepID=A0AAW9A7J5_9BACL|nr:CDP-glycerol glycerophosphotransferase family protein [Sporosarcina thermotolerans]MDW0116945.1 CDP-glycerol glycerophosphotransferase family protein [Sporosarcina thermotolerans]WHT47939.1 CDP-glycerol glycerophosphotransferase family protein [Sporosarcina thermotolerans]
MRYALHKYIQEMLVTLLEAADYIHNEKNNDEVIYNQLLLNSKEFLQGIKKVISENHKDTNNQKIFGQIKLCEKKVVELLIQNKEDRILELTTDLREDIKDLTVIFEKEISAIYHIVFFAELGQKWDSMQSVYEAFSQRSDCEVSVVLTPIFRTVETNGKIETDFIYEDYLTSLGINFIPYNKYDITKHLPDLVLISNPYESVTLPQFWPENIAKYTKLVYLPYYTTLISDDASIQVNCQFPVTKYAWRIIAQSEKVKELHKEFSPKKGSNVLVTGLPKWDEGFLSTTHRNIEWDSKLKGKKVFLWNTHYNITSNNGTLLEYGTSLIEHFFDRDDISLIWRPHPMTDTIFKLYQPQYLNKWEYMKEIINKSSNIVLDNNASSYMSFNYSDALISDYSSLLAQYLLTEKPIIWVKKNKEEIVSDETQYIFPINHLEQATSLREIQDFIDRVKSGVDTTKNKRLQIIQEEMSGADGRIGERVSELLMKNLQLGLP